MTERITRQEFYQYHYPFQKLEDVLTSCGDELANYEFAVEGSTSSGDVIYKRYISAKNASELKAAVLACPGIMTFHFGAIYDGIPSRHALKSRPVRRPLSFDLDLTDYDWLDLKDEHGIVCAALCDHAYPVSASSVFILQYILTAGFNFSNFLLVYSGRRGVHLHVFDESAMRLDDEARSAIVKYINASFTKNGYRTTADVRKVMVMHKLRDAVYFSFEEILIGDMDLFGSSSARVDFVNRMEIRHEALATLAEDMVDQESGRDAWNYLKMRVMAIPLYWLKERLDDTVLAYVWPRLDANVSKSLNHLTKVPFACHGKSGRVAVSIDLYDYYRFKPGDVPSLDCFSTIDLDKAKTHFRVGIAPGMKDVEDLVEATTLVTPRPLPRKFAFKAKRSPLGR
tara:strand:- start:360 stop:1553 length:1194 start_codon:yes stop_codon:yes gene_type:complete